VHRSTLPQFLLLIDWIPTNLIGRVLGTKGATITRIQDATKSKITVTFESSKRYHHLFKGGSGPSQQGSLIDPRQNCGLASRASRS